MVAAFSSGTSRRTGATNLAPHWRPICSRSSRPPNSTRVLQPTRRRCHCTARRVRIPATAELWNRRRGKRHRDVGDGAGLPHPHARRTNRVTRPLLPPAPSVVRRPGRLEGRGTRTLPGGECAELRAQRYGICGGRTPLAITGYSAGSPWRPYLGHAWRVQLAPAHPAAMVPRLQEGMDRRVHCLSIELNRGLYWDSVMGRPSGAYEDFRDRFAAALGAAFSRLD